MEFLVNGNFIQNPPTKIYLTQITDKFTIINKIFNKTIFILYNLMVFALNTKIGGYLIPLN